GGHQSGDEVVGGVRHHQDALAGGGYLGSADFELGGAAGGVHPNHAGVRDGGGSEDEGSTVVDFHLTAERVGERAAKRAGAVEARNFNGAGRAVDYRGVDDGVAAQLCCARAGQADGAAVDGGAGLNLDGAAVVHYFAAGVVIGSPDDKQGAARGGFDGAGVDGGGSAADLKGEGRGLVGINGAGVIEGHKVQANISGALNGLLVDEEVAGRRAGNGVGAVVGHGEDAAAGQGDVGTDNRQGGGAAGGV